MQHIFVWFSIATATFGVNLPAIARLEKPVPTQQPHYLLVSQEKPTEFEYEDFDFWAQQCQLLTEEAEYSEALIACEKAISLQPEQENFLIWEARSHALFNLHQYSQAILSYNHLLKLDPNYSLAWTQQCIALFHFGKYESALDSCEQALKVNGNWGNITPALAWYQRGLILSVSERLQYESQLDGCARVLKVYGDWDDVNLDLTWQYHDLDSEPLDSLQGILYSYEQALSINPNYYLAQAESYRLQALCSEDKRRQDYQQKALVYYKQALKLNPHDAISWIHQGLLLEQLGEYEQALVSYHQAVEILPHSSLALAHQCAMHNQVKDYQGAIVACQGAMEGDRLWGDTSVAYTWYETSTALLGMEEYEKALAATQRAIALQPEYAQAWNNQAVSLWHLGRLEEAQTASSRAIASNSPSPQTYFNRGRILSSLKKYSQAVAAYEQALETKFRLDNSTCTEIAKNHTSIEVIPNQLFCADVFTNQAVAMWYSQGSSFSEHWQSVLDCAKKATKLNPDSFAAWYNQAVIARKQKQYQEALNAYNRANRLQPENVFVLTGKGIALLGLGEYFDALAVFEQALAINPDYALAKQGRNDVLNAINNRP